MNDAARAKYLSIALVVIGLIFIFAVYPMMTWISPSGWRWMPPQPEYEQILMGTYATLGIFLIRAAKNPTANASLIWFTIWSNLVHATIMLLQVLADPSERAHLVGNIPTFYVVAGVLWYLMPSRGLKNQQVSDNP
ncbi:DUF6632 domain-containing protein [Microbulbifer sp. 2304DJ12-6]